MTSKDGYQWTETQGLLQGVPSIGLIHPPSNTTGENTIYDVIIIGAGYAALTAARDATTSGLRTIILEARDRIGGRSWSSNIGGYPFEMGGTWVSWGQAHVWREISRYDMRKELEISQDYSHGVNHLSLVTATGEKINLSHDDEDRVTISALKKFTNVDGEFGKKIMPFPNDEAHNLEAASFDRLTVADRLAQISTELSPQECSALKGWLLLCGGATLDVMSFYEFLHWWALCGHTYEGCIEYLIKYKFRGGQSSFAIKIWDEAISTKRLSYILNCPIAEVQDSGSMVTVTSVEGRQFRGSRVISTIPLNVLNTVKFDPPLSSEKMEAANIGHLNQCVKVHAEISNKDLRSWSSINPSSKLIYAFGDGTTPAGNTHVVAFGANGVHLDTEKNINETKQILKELTDMDIKRLVFHNWSEDPYAKGAWFFPGKEFITTYLDALRERQGNIFFANSDWAVGWRSFIDGAIEEGTRAGRDVTRDLLLARSHL
ncbi:hypothetical protein B0O99DRAFT_400695 [Bisporella sp. PMI_857]|nr:hypothetical protein B0O99DRAFT_400695 [Bisporella sp. PMI_857]